MQLEQFLELAQPAIVRPANTPAAATTIMKPNLFIARILSFPSKILAKHRISNRAGVGCALKSVLE